MDVTAIPLGRGLRRASSNQPGRRIGHDPAGVSLSRRPRAPSLFGLAPGGVCRAVSITGDAVRSYRTFSPLPRTRRGGSFSVALSLGSPPPDVIRHRCPWSPDFPLRRSFDPCAERPSDRLTQDEWRRRAARSSGGWRIIRAAQACAPPIEARSAFKVAIVEGSAMPSTRSGRKWRWNAVTTSVVIES